MSLSASSPSGFMIMHHCLLWVATLSLSLSLSPSLSLATRHYHYALSPRIITITEAALSRNIVVASVVVAALSVAGCRHVKQVPPAAGLSPSMVEGSVDIGQWSTLVPGVTSRVNLGIP